MPRVRNESLRESTIETIKTIARQQMSAEGTTGLSLRAIAREMDMTAPALYNYFPRLDDLITALLVDAFNGLADAVDTAIRSALNETFREQLKAGCLAYRAWAVTHKTDFELIYGNPIPNYVAPREVTVPLATRPLESWTRLVVQGIESGQMRLPTAYQQTPPKIHAFMQTWFPARVPPNIGTEMLYVVLVLWSRIHGMVMLELFDHLPPTVGDVSEMYALEVDLFLDTLRL